MPATGALPATGAVPGTGTVRGTGSVPGTGTAPGTGSLPGAGTASAPGTGTTPGSARGAGAAPGAGNARGTGRVPGTGAAPDTALSRGAGTTTGPADDLEADEGPSGENPGGLRGAGLELRDRIRSRRRLRVVTLVSLAVVVLVLLPSIFGIRSAGRDPVFVSLDSLQLPSWAATQVDDHTSGSRWCFLDCPLRERDATSQKSFKETTQAYDKALAGAGWQPWKVEQCPDQPLDPASGTYSCWKRDEFTLDLRVSLPGCAVDAIAAQDPDVVPTTGPDAVPPPTDPKKCVGSTVNIKVQNAIADTRGKPEPKQSPGLVGETPDPVLSDDPLLEPTPTAS
jgi:hypothetical protein